MYPKRGHEHSCAIARKSLSASCCCEFLETSKPCLKEVRGFAGLRVQVIRVLAFGLRV